LEVLRWRPSAHNGARADTPVEAAHTPLGAAAPKRRTDYRTEIGKCISPVRVIFSISNAVPSTDDDLAVVRNPDDRISVARYTANDVVV